MSLGGTTAEERVSNVENKIQQCFSKMAPTSSKEIFTEMKARADDLQEAQKAQLKKKLMKYEVQPQMMNDLFGLSLKVAKAKSIEASAF